MEKEKEKEKGTKRTRAANAGREKANKRAKGPAAVPPPQPVAIAPVVAPVLPPVVLEKKPVKPKVEDLRSRESDAASVLAGLGAQREEVALVPLQAQPVLTARPPLTEPLGQASLEPSGTRTPQQMPWVRAPAAHTPQPISRPPSSTPKKDKEKASMGAATSSYWSVPEQTDFPALLASTTGVSKSAGEYAQQVL